MWIIRFINHLLIIGEMLFIEGELPPLVEVPPVEVEVSPVQGIAQADVGEHAVVGGK